jgi:hypothetical protein
MNDTKLSMVGQLLDKLRKRSDHEAVKAAMESKGNITRMEGYANMQACLSRLIILDNGSGSLGKPLRVAKEVNQIFLKQQHVFEKAFQPTGSEALRFVYAQTVTALWHLISLLCSEGITFVKGLDGSYNPIVNKNGIDSLSGSVIVIRLEKFIELANKYGFESNMTEAAPIIEKEAFNEAIGVLGGIGLAITGILALLMLARDLAEKFYELRGTFSRWLDVQAKFLEMNAASNASGRPEARVKQEEYASRLRSLADRIKIDDADTERSANIAINKANISYTNNDTGTFASSQLL